MEWNIYGISHVKNSQKKNNSAFVGSWNSHKTKWKNITLMLKTVTELSICRPAWKDGHMDKQTILWWQYPSGKCVVKKSLDYNEDYRWQASNN